ncbi:MAG: hypothetical protein WD669_04160 [Pirellulales bacterium]
MPQANDIFGTAFKNGSAVLMARIVDSAGVNVQQSGLTAIKYSVFELDPCQPDSLFIVSGHNDVTLTVASVIYNALQAGGLWTVDAVGYNFRHEIDVSQDAAFPKAGVQYQVRYTLTPTSGQKTIVRFQIRVI